MSTPSQYAIRRAKVLAMGQGRKRCTKGKNCSSTCISQSDYCLVELEESYGAPTTKMRDFLRKHVILRGPHGGGPVSNELVSKNDQISKSDLDLMEGAWKRYTQTGHLGFPFKMPKKYDDQSGAPEALQEIVSLRDKLNQDKKTGKITVPDGVEVSKKAKELINEWNALDLSTVYTNSVMGNRLNVSGLGVQAGPRNTPPKDAIRGLIQYIGLRRQQAELKDTPNGRVITSYRDPFTGKRRPYMVNGEVVASQDHWEKPFGIFGLKSENDVKNTVYMPVKMNVEKGESSPARFMYILLTKNGRIEGKHAADRSVVGGFAGRYDKDATKDFLPKGVTREAEKKALGEKAQSMITTASRIIDEKSIPRITEALSKGEPTMAQAAKLVTDIAKHESTTNYFGNDLRFGGGMRVLTPYEQEIVKGINLGGPVPVLTRNIQNAMEATGKSPRQILEEVVENRKGYTPTASDGSKSSAPESAVGKTTEKAAPTPKASNPVTPSPKTKKEMAEQILRELRGE